jgi:hypothetical protein
VDALAPTAPPFLISDVPVSAAAWRDGDWLVIMADFAAEAVPPGTYWLDVGHYRLGDMQRIPRADGAGDSARFGPLRVE